MNAAPGGGFTFANDFTTVNNNGLITPGEAGGAGGFDGGRYTGGATPWLANGPGGFVGLGEGDAAVSIEGIDLVISYTAGDGNDLSLAAVPEPSSLLLVLAGLPVITRRRRNAA